MPQLFKNATVDDYYKNSLIEKTIEKLARAVWLYEPEQEEPLRRLPLAGAVCATAVYVGYSVGDVITQDHDPTPPKNGSP